MNFIPALLGLSLWAGATAILCEDVFHSGHLSITHALQPVLTAGTVAAAVWVHRARWFAKPAFLLLALIGSLATLYGTMGRQADAQDDKAATIGAANRTYGAKVDDLKAAKLEQARECKSIGPKCERWNARVDQLTRELSAIAVRSTNARADAIGRLATLVGGNGARTKEIVAAFDPILLPLFLEFGSIVFFAVAFPHRRPAVVNTSVTPAHDGAAEVVQSFTREAALTDLRRMRSAGSNKVLAEKWGVHPTTAGRWLAEWQDAGAVERRRDGKVMKAIAAPL